MKNVIAPLLAILLVSNISNAQKKLYVHDEDVHRFWIAYDQIVATPDSSQQLKIITEEYIKKGSEGLQAIMDKRGYTAESYINAIRSFPSFWESVRENTLKSNQCAADIEENILKLKALYPDLRSAQVYFTIGALMTGGTAHKGHVLIGSEIALADNTTVTKDIHPDWLRKNLHNHFQSNPIDDIVLLNVHEYVHTQQGDYGTNLLSMCVFEGVAEFVSVLAADKPSVAPAIPFGQANKDVVRERFQKEMFSPHWNDWLYNNRENEFGIRDLGYYVGYAICEMYYQQSSDKRKAIKEMIELDCTDKKAVYGFLLKSNYLSESYDILKRQYNANQPKVIGIIEFKNGSKSVNPDIKTMTIQFSKPINKRFMNFKLGSKGIDFLVPSTSVDWSEDGKSLILGLDMEAGKHYQLIVDNEFRDMEGRTIERYSIDFKTR